jgi:hypothetical protein
LVEDPRVNSIFSRIRKGSLIYVGKRQNTRSSITKSLRRIVLLRFISIKGGKRGIARHPLLRDSKHGAVFKDGLHSSKIKDFL